MIVFAIHIITDDGRTILSEYLQNPEDLPDAVLFGGFLTALQNLAIEMTRNRSEMRSIEIEGFSFHIRSFGLVRIVLVTDLPKLLRKSLAK